MLLFAMILLIRIAPRNQSQRARWRRGISIAMVLVLIVFTSSGFEVGAQNFGSGFPGASGTDTNADGSRESVMSSFQPKKNEELLREGTLIPPTIGKIVPVGRRWGFEPANPELLSQTHLESGVSSFRNVSSNMVTKQRPTRLGAATIMVTGRDLTRTEQPTTDTELINQKQASEAVSTNVKVQHILLAENLMLQRIVEAVIEDPADDRWTVSGEITEFRNQNRLLIHTAQRTNDN